MFSPPKVVDVPVSDAPESASSALSVPNVFPLYTIVCAQACKLGEVVDL